MTAVNSALVAVFDVIVKVHYNSITTVISKVAIPCKRVVVSAKRVTELLCLALPVWHEGVELVELVRGDVLIDCMKPILFSGVEVLVVETQQSVDCTVLERPRSESKLTLLQDLALHHHR